MMIKLIFSILGLALIQVVYAQNPVENNPSGSSKFHLGIHYSFLQNSLEIQSLKSHSVWDETDFGTDELSNEEIAEINSLIDYKKKVNGPFIAAGMVLLNKAGKPFYIEGSILLGIGFKKYERYNNKADKTNIKVKTDKLNPWIGIAGKVKYRINDTWGIQLTPIVSHSWGTSMEIDDNQYPKIQSMVEKREDKSSFWYYRAELMASYSFKDFSIALGPGFFYLANEREYRIERTDTDGSKYLDEITSDLSSKYFMDAGINFNWNITDHITFLSTAAYANDLFLWVGVNYNF